MHIGLDITPILPPRTGIGQFTLALLRELIPAAPDDEFILFVNSARRDPPPLPLFERPNVRLHRFILPGPLLHAAWRRIGAPPIEWFTGDVDVFHSPWGIAPPQRRGACVITVHDLHCLKHPEDTARWGGQMLARALPRSAARAHRIMASSAQTRRDLIERLGIPAEKITVVPLGVDGGVFRPHREPGAVEAIRSEYCLPPHYLLAVATLEPRKNLAGLLDGYAALRREMSDAPPLVIAGMDGARAGEARARAAALGLGEQAQFLGYVPDDHLPLLYNGAAALIQPALEEGFGLTILEAMASGVPVAASDIPVFREIYGNACAWFDPRRPESIAATLRELLASSARREGLRAAGTLIAQRMTWKSTAAQVLAVYREAAQLMLDNNPANSNKQ